MNLTQNNHSQLARFFGLMKAVSWVDDNSVQETYNPFKEMD